MLASCLAWLALIAGAPAAASGPAQAPSEPRPAPSLPHLVEQTQRDATALAQAVAPWTEALEAAQRALHASPSPDLAGAREALAQARALQDAASPKLAAAVASFEALRRAANGRRVYPSGVLSAASAFRGAAGAYHDRAARQTRLEGELVRAQAPAPAPEPAAPGGR